jgi:hypothetical protein
LILEVLKLEALLHCPCDGGCPNLCSSGVCRNALRLGRYPPD